jgi:hypothetical protein
MTQIGKSKLQGLKRAVEIIVQVALVAAVSVLGEATGEYELYRLGTISW